MRNVSQTLFLRMVSEALSRDWMQADKASCDKPWKTALWNNTNSTNKKRNGWKTVNNQTPRAKREWKEQDLHLYICKV